VKTILVTGATGAVGIHIVERFLQEPNVKVIGIGRKNAAIKHQRYTHITGDLRSMSLDQVIPFCENLDCLIHCAAESIATAQVDGGIYQYNTDLTKAAISLGVAFNTKQFMYATSTTMAGDYQGILTEDTPLVPTEAYGQAKLEDRRLAMEAFPDRYTELMLCNIVSPHVFNKLYINHIRTAQKGIPYSPKDINPDYTRSLIDGDDIANAVILLWKQRATEIFLIAGESVSLQEFFTLLEHVSRIKITPQIIESIQTGKSLKLVCNAQKLQSLGWKPKPLQEVLQKYFS